MLVTQISVFLENKAGRLSQVSGVLKENNINIRALSIADTTNFGILRLIVDNPSLAEKKLKEADMAVRATNVIAVCIEDKPGSLDDALKLLETESIGIEYMYAYIGLDENQAIVILKVDDPEKAVNCLVKSNIKLLSAEKAYNYGKN